MSEFVLGLKNHGHQKEKGIGFKGSARESMDISNDRTIVNVQFPLFFSEFKHKNSLWFLEILEDEQNMELRILVQRTRIINNSVKFYTLYHFWVWFTSQEFCTY